MKKTLLSLLAIAAVVAGCKKPAGDDPVTGNFVKLDKTTLTITEGETATLKATYEPESLTLSWSSSNESVATVADGVVTAVAEGTADIVVKAGTAEAKCKVTVEAKPAPAGEEYAYAVDAKSAWAVDWTDKTAKSAQWTIEVKFRKTGDWHTDGISNRLITVGTADIVVKAGTAEAKCKVTVEAKPAPAGEEYAYGVNAKSAWAVDWADKTAKSAQWTIEVKFRKTGDWHTDGISNRLITVGNAGEKGIMLRFNDDGGKHVGSEEYAILQVCSLPSVGNFYVGENTQKNPEGPYKFAAAEGGQVNLFKFMKDTWYTISFVNDGEKLYMYINGELHTTINDAAYELQLQRVDVGMVWGYAADGHDGKTGWVYRQAFDGELSYARCWYKACTESEIKANLCKLEDDQAAGLQMNLLFNEGEGTKIADKTGNGYDYDLTKAWWDPNGPHEACPNPTDVAGSAWKYVEKTCE